MADETENNDEYKAETSKKPGFSGKKLVLFIILPLLLILGGGSAAFLMGVFDSPSSQEESLEGETSGEEIPHAVEVAVFYDLPKQLVNLSNTVNGRQSNFLSISVSLELSSAEDVAKVEEVLPRIVDSFQVYMRELRVEDLRGSAGIQRLREELLLRVNASVAPVVIEDVLFQEMIVQ